MRSNLVAANWKMNGNKALVAELLEGFVGAGIGVKSEVIVFAPSIFLPMTEGLLSGSSISWGGQNCSEWEKGAFTGETSMAMLQEFGCSHVLVGHSERRSIYGETDEVCAAKVKAALDQGLSPVLCVGETLEQRESGVTESVVKQQIEAVVSHIGIQMISKCVIAYEPVWAIGTGKTASPEQAQDVHAFIRSLLTEQDAEIANKVQILYGGSVNGATAKELFGMPDIDGGLVGGASLKLEEFVTICKAAD